MKFENLIRNTGYFLRENTKNSCVVWKIKFEFFEILTLDDVTRETIAHFLPIARKNDLKSGININFRKVLKQQINFFIKSWKFRVQNEVTKRDESFGFSGSNSVIILKASQAPCHAFFANLLQVKIRVLWRLEFSYGAFGFFGFHWFSYFGNFFEWTSSLIGCDFSL